MFMPAVSLVDAMNSINVGVVPERLLWLIGRLRFSWNKGCFKANTRRQTGRQRAIAFGL